MNFIDAVVALIIMGFFLFGFSHAFLPALNEWNRAASEFYTAHTIYFVAESFKKECANPYRNMEKWRETVKVAKELESCEITELMKDDGLYALRAACIISGEFVEILGLCKE